MIHNSLSNIAAMENEGTYLAKNTIYTMERGGVTTVTVVHGEEEAVVRQMKGMVEQRPGNSIQRRGI